MIIIRIGCSGTYRYRVHTRGLIMIVNRSKSIHAQERGRNGVMRILVCTNCIYKR